MKKIIVVLFLMVISVSTYSQKRFETEAKATVETMKTVISITSEEEVAIYNLELKSNLKRGEIRKNNAGNQSQIRTEMKVLDKEKRQDMMKILGKSKMAEWSNYLKEQREKKE
jgi:hypothetical protein